MIELMEWARTVQLPPRPWLVLGKGPTFSRRGEFDLGQYNLVSLNHVVREMKVHVAHMIDVDVVEACGPRLLEHCDWLLMPRRPHVNFDPSRVLLLEDFVSAIPVLRELDARGRLVWYNLSSGPPVGDSPVIRASFFSSEAALNVLAAIGARTVRSLGVDGGRAYSPDFRDLEGKTRLAAGQPSFDLQFRKIAETVIEAGLDYAPLVEPLRIFVGTDRESMIATRVLEYSIRKHASRPVEVVPMLDLPVPMPRDEANRPRTGFSFSRFLIPGLCNYRGRALYLDADMQVFADVAELWDIPFGPHKVLCTNQPEPPAAWKNFSFFHPGRQMSVMMLDCSRLDWDIREIVRGLDEGKYDYRRLMFDLCVVPPDEIADALPPAWNHLEHFEPGKTRLLHYTVGPTQPWRNDENPLRGIWEECYREAVEAGAVLPEEVERDIAARYEKALKPSLADCLPRAFTRRPRASSHKPPPPSPGPGASTAERLQALEAELADAGQKVSGLHAEADAARQVAYRLSLEMAALRRSLSWKVGRAVTTPGRVLRKVLRDIRKIKSA